MTSKIPVFYIKEIEDYLRTSPEIVSVSEFIRDSIKEKLLRLQNKELNKRYFLLTKDIVFNEETINLIHEDVMLNGGDKGILKQNVIQKIINKSLDLDYLRFLSKFLVNFADTHPFNDGNKRTSWIVVDVFLRLNKMRLNISVKENIETKDEVFIWQNSINQKKTDQVTDFLNERIIDYKENSEDVDIELKRSIQENQLLLTKLSR